MSTLLSTAAYRRLALALTGLLAVMVTLVWHSSTATAAGTAYPPPPPCTSGQAASGSSGSSCAVEPTQVQKPTPGATTATNGHQSNDLASTGFQTATAVAIVVVLFAAGGLFLAAGSRRRHG